MAADFELLARIAKLSTLNKDGQLKMIWMWTYQKVITFAQFKKLMEYCANQN